MPKKYLDLDIDSTFAANSDYYIPSQKAVKTALENKVDSTNLKTINNTSLIGTGNINVDSLPDQTSQAGKILTTDGTDASWTEKPEVVFRKWE